MAQWSPRQTSPALVRGCFLLFLGAQRYEGNWNEVEIVSWIVCSDWDRPRSPAMWKAAAWLLWMAGKSCFILLCWQSMGDSSQINSDECWSAMVVQVIV